MVKGKLKRIVLYYRLAFALSWHIITLLFKLYLFLYPLVPNFNLSVYQSLTKGPYVGKGGVFETQLMWQEQWIRTMGGSGKLQLLLTDIKYHQCLFFLTADIFTQKSHIVSHTDGGVYLSNKGDLWCHYIHVSSKIWRLGEKKRKISFQVSTMRTADK